MATPIFYFDDDHKLPSNSNSSCQSFVHQQNESNLSSSGSSSSSSSSVDYESDQDAYSHQSAAASLDIQVLNSDYGTPHEIVQIVPIHNVDLVNTDHDDSLLNSANQSTNTVSTAFLDTQGSSTRNTSLLSQQMTLVSPSASVNNNNSTLHKVGKSDFQLLKVIGKGAYGKVFLVRKIHGIDKNQYYAMKVLKKAHIVLHQKDTEHTQNERSILEEVRHPFLVRLFYAFQTDSKLYLILDYAPGGELFMYLEKEKMLMEDVAQFYMAELVLALEHLHKLGIIYRDLKPENVLLDQEGHVKLTDFGLSKVALNEDQRANTVCGTVEYMAPEILANLPYGKMVDWWSLGALSYDMMTGKPPFSSSNRKKTMDYIMNKKLSLPYYLTPDAKDLLTKLLRKRPDARLGHGDPDARSIRSHRFFHRLDWSRLLARTLPPPIQPTVTAPDDVTNFHPSFTSLPVVDSPPMESEWDRQQVGVGKELFRGFSFVAKSVLDEHFEEAVAARTLQRRTD